MNWNSPPDEWHIAHLDQDAAGLWKRNRTMGQALEWGNLMLACTACGHESHAELARPAVQAWTILEYESRQSCLKHDCGRRVLAFVPEGTPMW